MLQDYKNKVCCVVDNGLFTYVAVILAKYFKKVYYYTEWVSAFPRSNDRLPGVNMPGVTRCNDYWEIKDEVDLWVFPDIYQGSLQVELESQGKRVWGSRKGDELELKRKECKEYLKKIKIPVGKYEVIIGIEELRKHLKKHDDQWIKTSTVRGDFETFHSVNYKNIEPKLDELEHILGAKKRIYEFIVEEGIPDAVEVGYDGYCVDGKFPKKAMCGIEVKDKGYIGFFKNYQDMPQQIVEVNARLADTLKNYGYKNFFAAEMRIKKNGDLFVIDPCCRMGSPPGELVQMMYTNLPDIFWYGAEGKCIDPIPAGKYGCEILIHSSWADKNWQAIQFPKEVSENVKLRNPTIIDGEYYVVPRSVGLPEIGAIVAVGNTLDEAMNKVGDVAEKIEGYYIDHFVESLEEAQSEIKKLKEFGVNL